MVSFVLVDGADRLAMDGSQCVLGDSLLQSDWISHADHALVDGDHHHLIRESSTSC